MHSVCSLATTPFFCAKLCSLTCYALTSHPVVQNTICACGDRSDRFRWLHNRKIIVILPSVCRSVRLAPPPPLHSLPPSFSPSYSCFTYRRDYGGVPSAPPRSPLPPPPLSPPGRHPHPPSVRLGVRGVRPRPSPSSLTFCTGCLIAC